MIKIQITLKLDQFSTKHIYEICRGNSPLQILYICSVENRSCFKVMERFQLECVFRAALTNGSAGGDQMHASDGGWRGRTQTRD